MKFRPLPLCGALMLLSHASHAALTISLPRCEYLVDPLGLGTTHPRFSWIVESPERGEKQTAYQLLVASTPELLEQDKGDLWDTGKVTGDATNQLAYAGKELVSRGQGFWKVKSWDKDDKPSSWSKPAFFTIGLLEKGDWSARWIDAGPPRMKPAPGQPMPVITSAGYEAVDGAGSLDVTAKLKALSTGPFTVNVENDDLGNDPAFNHVKHLRVNYEVGGVKTVRYFPEKATLNFPSDLAPPPVITRVTYEALDGKGSLDVTKLFAKKAEAGQFRIAVDNADLGSDPAPSHVKALRIEYTANGETHSKSLPEKSVFVYPSDLMKVTSIPYLRHSFSVNKPVAKATLYATALGIYEMRMNGQRVGDHILAPEWTDYNKRLRYQEYDVTPLLAGGENVVGAELANGWYSGHIGNGNYQYWGKTPALYAQLEITYKDGSSERVITDGKWKIHAGAVLASDFMLGEEYDSRKEIAGWDKPGFKDADWQDVTERDEKPRIMNAQVMEPVRELMEIHPKALTEPAPGKWTYDLGQNMVGVVRLKISASAGTKITIRHAEMLNPNGTVYTDNLRGAPSVDTYTCKGGAEETWQPKFTFHGFRYVEITGVGAKPPLTAVTGIVYGSDTPKTGDFTCSDPRVNQLQSNIVWGQRGNYLSVPTDCPQRDERLGWMGDAQVFVRTATYNSDVAAFFTKWLVDVTDSQSAQGAFMDVSPAVGVGGGAPAWGDAGVICPWTVYQAYGDRQLLEREYPAMTRWVDYCYGTSSNGIRSGSRGADYGDWLSIGADTSKELIGTGYLAYSTDLVARSAAALGKTEDAKKYQDRFEEVKKAFIAKYVSKDGHVFGETQCGYLMALRFNLLPDDLRPKAADLLEKDIIAKGYHLSTGFVGVSYLLPELTKAGKVDTAYRLLLQDTFPSWLFSVKMGATTIWERWDGWTPDKGFQNVIMNSFNHYSLGSCGEWLYASAAGISTDPAAPGFKKIIIHPVPNEKLTQAAGKFRSINGQIASGWTTKGGVLTLSTTIPANTTATVYVPTKDVKSITESGKPVQSAEGVKFLRMEGADAVFSVESGTYQFTSKNG